MQAFLFRQYLQAVSSGDQLMIQRALMAWLDALPGIEHPARFDQFMAQYGSEKDSVSIAAFLERSPDILRSEMNHARKRWLQVRKQQTVADKLLPPLNP